MGWSPWLRLADKNWFYVEQSLWYPVCYELAFGPSAVERDDQLDMLYVGAAANERLVFDSLEEGSAEISAEIRKGLDAGQTLYYRSQARPTQEAVAQLRELRLEEMRYRWLAGGDQPQGLAASLDEPQPP